MIEYTRQGAVDLIQLRDSLTYSNVDRVRTAIEQTIKPGQPRLVLDLREMALCDSQGLELILDLRDRCVKRGGMFKLAGASHLCQDILRVTGLLDQIEHYEDSVLAAGSFAV